MAHITSGCNARNWKTGGARFKPRSRLSTKLFEVFPGFLRLTRKYGLGSLKKTSTESIPPIGPGPTSGQLALRLQPANQLSKVTKHWYSKNFH